MIVPAAGQGLTFQGLPNEILLSIADWLDDVSAVCLKNTNSFFRSIIHREPGSFSLCSKWLIMCRFETDLLLQFSGCTTLPKNFPEELVCGFCKVKRPVHQIGGRRVGSKNMGFPVYTNTRPLIPSSIDRYCVRHPLSISWVKPDERSSGPHIEKRWAMSSQLTCMHCAAHVDDRDTRVTGCDRCHCDVCPRGTDNLFTRYGPLSWFAWGDRPHIISLEYFGNGICYVNENGEFSSRRCEIEPGNERPLAEVRPNYYGNPDVSVFELPKRTKPGIRRTLQNLFFTSMPSE